MTYFIKMADTYRITPNSAVDISERLPAGTYAVKIDDNGYFVERIQNFKLPSRLYGNTTRHADKIIGTFFDRPNSTGVFLEGEKGSGKTLLAKTISQKMMEKGHPTLVVNTPFFGEGFNTFLQAIDQPKVVIFDEFEKVYSGTEDLDAQERVLTLFDGVYPSKSLYVVTVNDSYRVDKNMKNRPGRMYYMLQFGGLDEEFIREYATENLNDPKGIDSIVAASMLFASFNFDMLQALVEEMNRYGESANEALKMLNAKPTESKDTFEAKIFVAGEELTLQPGHDVWSGSPISQTVHINHFTKGDTSGSAGLGRASRDSVKTYYFEPKHLTNIDGGKGTFNYTNNEGVKCVLTRKRQEHYDYSHLIA